MLDILDIINEATKEANSFENHAAKELSLEDRLLYLQGLSLVMNADGEIHEDEKEYLRILIKSFEMDDSILNSFVEFAQAPDKDTVQAFFRTFRRKPIAQLFLFDALMMTRRDGSGCNREKAVVDKIAEQLEVLKGTYSDIYDLFCHIKNKDWEESAVYFTSHLLNPDHFKHLLDYFEVDKEALFERAHWLRQSRLAAAMQKHLKLDELEWEELHYSDSSIDLPAMYVSKTSVRLGDLPYSLMVPFIQSLLDKKQLKILNGIGYYPLENGEEEQVLDFSQTGLEYNQESKSVFLAKGADESDVPVDGWNGKLVIKIYSDLSEDDSLIDQVAGLYQNILACKPVYDQVIGNITRFINEKNDNFYVTRNEGQLSEKDNCGVFVFDDELKKLSVIGNKMVSNQGDNSWRWCQDDIFNGGVNVASFSNDYWSVCSYARVHVVEKERFQVTLDDILEHGIFIGRD